MTKVSAKRKAPPKRGRPSALLEQIPKAERGLPVELVVDGFPGVPYPLHALPPVAGDEGLSACLFHLPVIRALSERLGLGVRMPNFIGADTPIRPCPSERIPSIRP